MLVTPSSVTKVWARTQHAPLYAVMRTAVRHHLRNQTIYLPTVSFVSFRRKFMGIFYHLKVYFDSNSETKLVPNILIQVSIREIHNSKYVIYADNNIIISDSTLRNISPPQLNKIYEWYKVMCGCECYISYKIMHSYLLRWWDLYLSKLKYQIQNEKT